jgi:hypothetical protein
MSAANNSIQYVPRITVEEYDSQKREFTQKALIELNKQLQEQGVKLKYSDLDVNEEEDATVVDNALDASNDMNYFISDNHDYDDIDKDDNDDNDNDDHDHDDNVNDNFARDNTKSKHVRSTKGNGVNVIINANAGLEIPIARNTSRSGHNCQNSQYGNDGLRCRKAATPSNKKDSASLKKKDLAEIIYAKRETDLQYISRLRQSIKKLEINLEEEERKNHFLKLDLSNTTIENEELKKNILISTKQVKKLDADNHHKGIIIIIQKIIIALFILHYIYFILLGF